MFPYGLTRDDFARVREIVPGVRLATATREHRREIRYRDRALDGRVVAVTPEYWQIQDIHLASGRFLGDLDARSAAAVAVLGADAAEVLFRADEPLGRSIRVGADQYYQVVGVAARRAVSPGLGSSLPAQDFNRDVYIPLPTDAARFGRYLTYHRAGELEKDGIELNQITLALEDISRVRETAGIVSDFLDEAHKQDDVAVTVPLDLLEKVEEAGRLFRLVLAAIASISLLVGGIGIMNIMLATVSERTREIGIRRALGATRADIIRQFLAESMLLSGCGGVAGILLGIVATWCLAFFVGVSTIVRPGAPLLAFGIALAVGLGFGTYPARRAAFLDPTEALRHE
jgi:putative ABC transport system permease protein